MRNMEKEKTVLCTETTPYIENSPTDTARLYPAGIGTKAIPGGIHLEAPQRQRRI